MFAKRTPVSRSLRSRSGHAPSRRARLRVEQLEDRLALSVTAPPTINIGPPITLQEGSQPVFALQGTFSDPGYSPQGDYATGEFFVRDSQGTLQEFGGATVRGTDQTLIYDVVPLPPGTYTLELDLNIDGFQGSSTTTLTMLPPVQTGSITVNAGPDVSAVEGTQPNSIDMSATFQDPNSAGQTYLPCAFYVTRESDGTLVEDGGVQVNVQAGTLKYSVVQVLPGDYTITLRLSDGGMTGIGVTHLHVLPNTPPPPPTAPQVVAPASAVISEGGNFGGVYSFTDKGPGPWTVDVNLGDGRPDLVLNNVTQPGGFSLSALYLSDSFDQPGGVFHGSVTVTDKGTGLTGSAPFTVQVLDVAPVVSSPASITVNAQTLIPMTASFSDPGPAEYWSALFTVRTQSGALVEDGGVQVNQQSRTLQYDLVNLTPGIYTVTLQVNDASATGTAVTQVTVAPFPNWQAPQVTAPADGTILEGGTFTGTYSFQDLGPGPWKVDINTGNSSGDLIVSEGPGSYSLAARYFADSASQTGGAYTGTVTVTDLGTGLSGSATFHVRVLDVAPVVDAGSDVTTFQKGVIPMQGFFIDDGPNKESWTASFTVRTAGGATVQTGSAQVDPTSKGVTYNVVGLAPGSYTVTLQVADGDATGSATTHLLVLPLPAPVVTGVGSGTVKEGGTFTGSYSFSALGYGPWTVRVDPGNGSAPLVFQQTQPGTYSFAAQYLQDSSSQPGGVFHGTVTVTDSRRLSSSSSFSVLVQEVPPAINLPPVITLNQPLLWRTVPLTVSYSDPAPSGVVSASYIVRDHRGHVVAHGTGIVNASARTVRFDLRRLPLGNYTISFSLLDDGQTVSAATRLRVLPHRFWPFI